MSWWSHAIGLSHSETKCFTASDLAHYEQLTGDARLGEVPVGLLAGVFSKILGMDLPGVGTNYLKQRMTIISPAQLDEILTMRVEIDKTVPEKKLVYLDTTCMGEDGRTVAQGRALVLARGAPEPTKAKQRSNQTRFEKSGEQMEASDE